MSHLRDLDRAECLELIALGRVGRAAVCTPDGPHVVPVSYASVDETVAIRTSAHSMLGTYGRASVVAFEVDDIDHKSRSGWSVVARGRCFVETDPRALVRLRDALGDAWVGGARTLYLRLPLADVSGRVLGRPVVAAPRHGSTR